MFKGFAGAKAAAPHPDALPSPDVIRRAGDLAAPLFGLKAKVHPSSTGLSMEIETVREPSEAEMARHLMELETAGVTLVPNAIPAPLLSRLRTAFDTAVTNVQRSKPQEEWSWESDEPGVVDFFRAYERDPAFEELMDLPSVFPILARALRGGHGRPAGEPRLLSGPVCQHLPGGSDSQMAWHRDGDYIRLTFFLEDVPADGGGGTGFIPGSHLVDADYAEVLNDTTVGGERGNGAPRPQPGATVLSGPAGSVAINWTMVYHTRTPSTVDGARRTFWQVYRRAGQTISGRPQDNLSAGYRAARSREWAESHPGRVALMDDSELEEGGWNLEGLGVGEMEKEMRGSEEFTTARRGKL